MSEPYLLNKKRLLTVVVPVYNVENYLEKCVVSLINQTYRNIEIILVDDGSTDQSGIVSDMLSRKSNNVKVIHQQNQGLSGARNTGIENAKGEYITFVDSDDYVTSDMYENLIGIMEQDDSDIAIGGAMDEYENHKKPTYPSGIRKVFIKEEALAELNSFRYFNMSFCTKVFKRSLFEEDGYGDGALRFSIGKISEDQYLIHKVIARAEKISYDSTPYYHCVVRQGSITRGKRIHTAELNAALERRKYYQKWFPSIVFSAETQCVFSAIGIYNQYILRGKSINPSLKRRLFFIINKFRCSIYRNQFLSNKKKIQLVLFLNFHWLYRKLLTRGK